MGRLFSCLLLIGISSCHSSDDVSTPPSDAGAVDTGLADSGDAESPWCTSNPHFPMAIVTSSDPCTTGMSHYAAYGPISTTICIQCTPRCGATQTQFNGVATYATTDLPTGVCSTDGETCDLLTSTTNNLIEYRCQCGSGAWSCWISGSD